MKNLRFKGLDAILANRVPTITPLAPVDSPPPAIRPPWGPQEHHLFVNGVLCQTFKTFPIGRAVAAKHRCNGVRVTSDDGETWHLGPAGLERVPQHGPPVTDNGWEPLSGFGTGGD